MDALINRSSHAPNLKNYTDGATERAVVDYAVAFSVHGQHRTSNDLCKQGVFISGSCIRSVLLRNNLENFKKRLKALEEKVARGGIELTDSQIATLERKASDNEACDEIEITHSGYLGWQDTFYVGNLKCIRRIYQQTFVDTYSKAAHCKLYVTKPPITAADLLNEMRRIGMQMKETMEKSILSWLMVSQTLNYAVSPNYWKATELRMLVN